MIVSRFSFHFRALALVAAVFLSPVATLHAEPAATVSVDDVARGLAGLAPISGMAGFSGPGYAQYASRVEQSWNIYLGRIGTPMSQWAARELPATTDKTVFYPFSGPDFPTPVFLRPDATHFILIANQRAGQPVAPAVLTPVEANRLFQKYQTAWQKFGVIGFFLTNDLMRDTRPTGKEINPTGILMAFASRLGFSIESVVPVTLAANGDIREEKALPENDWSSVRVVLRRGANRQKIVLDYVYMDLSDVVLAKHPENLNFIRKSGRHPVLFKAASHLPQNAGFTQIRQAVVEGSEFIIQDETGIDYGLLSHSHRVQLYGAYTRQHNLFPGTPQRELAKAYKDGDKVRKLGFKIGYEKASGSALMVALQGKLQVAAEPAPATPPVRTAAAVAPAAAPQPAPTPVATTRPSAERLEQSVRQDIEAYRKRERVVFVALEDRGSPYRDYLAQMQTGLTPILNNLQHSLPAGKSAVLALRPAGDGKLAGVYVVRSSGDAAVDKKLLAGFPAQTALPRLTPQLAARGEQLQVIFTLARN